LEKKEGAKDFQGAFYEENSSPENQMKFFARIRGGRERPGGRKRERKLERGRKRGASP